MGPRTRTVAFRCCNGVTVVELVVILILLCILAATALPRFLETDERHRSWAFASTLGGFQAGVALYHEQWIALEQPPAGTNLDLFGNLRSTAQGYPYGTRVQPNHVPAVAQDCEDVFRVILRDGPSTSGVDEFADVVGSKSDFTIVRSGANCRYYYTAVGSESGTAIPLMTFATATGAVTRSMATLP